MAEILLSGDERIGTGCATKDAGIHVAVGEEPTRDASIPDHFVERQGMRFAGTHLIIDLWRASNLDDLGAVEQMFRSGAEVANATLLNIDLHRFTPSGGITGVAMLAESHMSIHTWPERRYAAIDVFMCGQAKPHKAVSVIQQVFSPEVLTLVEHRRGLTP